MDKVIEAMAEALSLFRPADPERMKNFIRRRDSTIKRLLNLRYDCTECGGDGSVNDIDDHPYPCSKCNGTGKGSRMLAVLSENQEVSEPDSINYRIPDDCLTVAREQKYLADNLYNAYSQAQQDMLRTDKDGCAFRRVKVQDDNNG